MTVGEVIRLELVGIVHVAARSPAQILAVKWQQTVAFARAPSRETQAAGDLIAVNELMAHRLLPDVRPRQADIAAEGDARLAARGGLEQPAGAKSRVLHDVGNIGPAVFLVVRN